jgi:hypothetical protein
LSTAGTLLNLAAGNFGKADAKQKEQKMKTKVLLVKSREQISR